MVKVKEEALNSSMTPNTKLHVGTWPIDMQLHKIKINYLLWSEGFWEAVVGCAEETVDAVKMIIKFEIKNNGKYRIIETSLL